MCFKNGIVFWLIATLYFTGCNQSKPKDNKTKNEITENRYVGSMLLDSTGAILPFIIDVNYKNKTATIHNSNESITLITHSFTEDSMVFHFPVFDSKLVMINKNNESYSGYWYNGGRNNPYKLQVNFTSLENQTKESSINVDLTGSWDVIFSKGKISEYPAVGIFEQKGSELIGTFLTETGDYRFLSGTVTNDKFILSCLDGSHAFLFEGLIYTDSLVGRFWSGAHYTDTWFAVKNDKAQLTHPDSLTYATSGEIQNIKLKIKDIDGNSIQYPSTRFKGKVTIIQIMGTWCPNCKDESEYLSSLYKTIGKEKLEIISIGFEAGTDVKKAEERIRNLKNYLKTDYIFAYGGTADKDEAEAMFPFLNHIMAFPTTIFIDKSGRIRKIHTGFYGPGTGKYYHDFITSTNTFVRGLTNE